MKNLKLIVMFLAVASLTLSACKKEEAATPTPSADKKTLLSKTWKISEYYEDGQLIQNPVLTSARMTFNAAGTYTSIFDGDTDNGTWAFNSAQDRIILDGGTAFEQTWTIQDLTSARLKVRYTDDGTGYEIIYVPS